MYNAGMSQLAIGPFVSTNNIPAANFKKAGGGITAEVSNTFIFSLAYFEKGFLADSIFYTNNDGNSFYLHYVEKFRFIHASASFFVYLIGGRDSEKKFSAYVGTGLAGIYRMQEVKFNDPGLTETSKENTFIFGFNFLAGIDYKIGPVKPFIRTNGTITLKHIIPGDYDTALPYMGNLQVGILIPFESK